MVWPSFLTLVVLIDVSLSSGIRLWETLVLKKVDFLLSIKMYELLWLSDINLRATSLPILDQNVLLEILEKTV